MEQARALVDGYHCADATGIDSGWCCEAACVSDRGNRSRQEDAALLGDTNGCIRVQGENKTIISTRRFDTPSLFAVVDGMGGHPAGNLASSICISNLSKLSEKTDGIQTLNFAIAAIQQTIEESASAMNQIGLSDTSKAGMGATIVLLAVCNDGCAILNIGDCRAYTFRDGGLKQLTKDDTEGQRLLDLELLEQHEINKHPDRDRLTRYVGKDVPGLILRAHEEIIRLEKQTILLCSDGIARALSSEEMLGILKTPESVGEQCQSIVEKAKQKGATDNMTALLIRIEK